MNCDHTELCGSGGWAWDGVGRDIGPSLRLKRDRDTFYSWIAAHQTGNDFFVVKSPKVDLPDVRADATSVKKLSELLRAAEHHPDAHFLLPLATAAQLAGSPEAEGWRLDSRIRLSWPPANSTKRTRPAPLSRILSQSDAVVPRLIMTDQTMPRLTGLEMITIVRERGYRMPIILLSGFSDGSCAREVEQLANVIFLAKPFGRAELLQTVHRLLAAQS